MTSPSPDLRMGIYRHYRGHLYQVLGLAHDANAEDFYDYSEITPKFWDGTVGRDAKYERIVVVYIGLELDAAHLGPRLAVRTLEDFTALVHPDGTICLPGEAHRKRRDDVPIMRRFDYLGPVLTADMIQERPKP